MNQPVRILFASPFSLLDTTSGAAISVEEFLTQLSERGFVSEAVTASIFDPSRQVPLDEVLARRKLSPLEGPGSAEAQPFIEVLDGKVKHTIYKTANSRRYSLTREEGEGLQALVERKIKEFHPDLLFTYGGLAAELNIHRLARRQGVPVVFYLANGLYSNAKTFADVDLILVPSKFLGDYYRRKLGLESRVLYSIIPDSHSQVARRAGRYITFINPTPPKGVTFFWQVATEALRQIPRAEFLVVEGRWTWADAAKAGMRFHSLANVKVIPNQPDVRPVYAVSRILLFPSLWQEAAGRILVEAQRNGIPVLATRQGGIPEALNEGGFLFDVPERCKTDYTAFPTPEEIQPWIDRLRVLLESEDDYEEAQRRALEAAEAFRPEKILQSAVDIFLEFLGRVRPSSPPEKGNEGPDGEGVKRLPPGKSPAPAVRAPVVAGRFYPAEREELRRQLSGFLEASSVTFEAPGVMVPHAGYIYSGRIAGEVYGRIRIPDQVILLGPNHTGRGAKGAVMADGEWVTPLGRAPIDSLLAAEILDSSSLLEQDMEAHRVEHSLEVQLPFLSYLHPAVRIVPITLKSLSLEECLKMGADLAGVIRRRPGAVLLVASTDMTHYQPREIAREDDQQAIDQLLAMSPEGLYRTVQNRRISMCGMVPTVVVLKACLELGAARAQLVAYGDSGDANQDLDRVVGYAGVILRE